MHQGSRSLQDDVLYADDLNQKADVGFASKFWSYGSVSGERFKVAVVNVILCVECLSN